jgi:hypothetical protein
MASEADCGAAALGAAVLSAAARIAEAFAPFGAGSLLGRLQWRRETAAERPHRKSGYWPASAMRARTVVDKAPHGALMHGTDPAKAGQSTKEVAETGVTSAQCTCTRASVTAAMIDLATGGPMSFRPNFCLEA